MSRHGPGNELYLFGLAPEALHDLGSDGLSSPHPVYPMTTEHSPVLSLGSR